MRIAAGGGEGFAFLLPGNSPFEAALHLARTAARRAERAAWNPKTAKTPAEGKVSLNRGSDCLCNLALLCGDERERLTEIGI
jgi:cob(I)alamin adenosyltransferase